MFHLISQLSGDIKIAINSSVGEVLLTMLGKTKTKLANDEMIKIWSNIGCYIRYMYMFRKVRYVLKNRASNDQVSTWKYRQLNFITQIVEISANYWSKTILPNLWRTYLNNDILRTELRISNQLGIL